MSILIQNLLHAATAPIGEEEITTLLAAGGVRIERIVSHGQSSPDGFWYDQPDPEWVALLRGSATLSIDGREKVELGAGDYLLIPAHLRHRVKRTSEDAVWLVVHLGNQAEVTK
jgi:cupin 2 domain-containing protein